MAVKTIQSVTFPGVFLRMDGSGVTQFTGPGGGVVNSQFGAHAWEKFKIVTNQNGATRIESNAFPGVYLRMDGTGVTQFTGPGSGVVNCQFGAHAWEKFNLVPSGPPISKIFSIESRQWPGVFLRLDGTGVTQFTGPGAGVVNCQLGAHAWERFKIA